jgi:HK97 family phage portal protein
VDRGGLTVANPLARLSSYLGGLWQRWNGTGWGRLRLLLPGTRFDYEREAGDTWTNSIVAIALQWLGDRFPRPILRVSKIARSGDYVPLGRHPLVDLWSRPNPHYTRRTLEKAIGLSLKVDGNAFVWKRRNLRGQVIELWWLPHYAAAPVYPADGSAYLTAWRFQIDGLEYDLPPEDVIHFRDGIDPRNDRLGLSALKAQLREVCTINEESSYTATILNRCGVPGMVVMPADKEKGRFDPVQARRAAESIDDATRGDRRGSTVGMTGAVDVKILGFSPEQLRLDRLPLSAQARIAAACGTALMSLGLPDPGKTYSNLGEANRSSWGTIVAIQELQAETLRWQLLPEFDDPHGYTIEYDYSLINELQEDLSQLHARAREDWKAGGITLNEYREAIGLEPVDDGDRFFPGTEPAAIGAESGPADVGTATVADVQATALNGAQIASLLEIVQALVADALPPESARAMLLASFPVLTPQQVNAIVDPAAAFEAPKPDPPPEPPGFGQRPSPFRANGKPGTEPAGAAA